MQMSHYTNVDECRQKIICCCNYVIIYFLVLSVIIAPNNILTPHIRTQIELMLKTSVKKKGNPSP